MTTFILSNLDASSYRTLSCDGVTIVKANFETILGVRALQILLGSIAQSTQNVVINEGGEVLVGDVGQLDPIV